MKTKEKTHDPRTMKFAEAGILLVLVLGLTLFIGVKMNARNADETVAEAVVETVVPAEDLAMIVETVATAEPETLTYSEAAVTESPIEETPIVYARDIPAAQIYQDGELAYFAGDYEKAAEIFGIYGDRREGNAWGHYMLGLSLHKAGADADAVDALQTALEIKPDHLKSLINLARVHLEMDNPEAALSLIETAVDLQPDNVSAWRMMGRVTHNLQRVDEAVAAYRYALYLDMNDAWSLNNLGLVLIESGRSDEALPVLARAILVDSDVACFHNNLGVALERSGYVELAADTYRAALDIDPDYQRAATSLERVSGRETDTSLPPVDLLLLATEFTITGPESTNDEIVAAAFGD